MEEADSQSPPRRIALVRYEDDHGLVRRGSLIPLALKKRDPQSLAIIEPHPLMVVGKVLVALLLLVGLSFQMWQLLDTGGPQLATVFGAGDAPPLMVRSQYSELLSEPRFGPAPAFSDQAYYAGVREALVAGAATFVDLDLTTMTAQYFKAGVLEERYPIAKKPASDSWCAVAAGLYAVQEVKETHTSTYLGVLLPASVSFGANLLMHGVPEQVDGSPVDKDFDRDCLRLDTTAARTLAAKVGPGTVVIVHEVPKARPTEIFAYESKVPRFSTPYYLIADLKSDTVLAVGDKHAAVPIASLTKLMTALVALEHLSLDDQISIEEPSLIESLVPRLHERSKVSVHTLLELLLVESSNEAAEVLASAVGREKFITLMNERAASLGLLDTIFTDPSGVDAGNVSSVNDLWWLTRYLYLHRPLIFTLTEDKATPPPYVDDAFSGLVNFNRVETVDSFIGGKIGETEAAKQTSVTLHRLTIADSQRDIAVIVLASEARRDDVIRLLDYIKERFGE